MSDQPESALDLCARYKLYEPKTLPQAVDALTEIKKAMTGDPRAADAIETADAFLDSSKQTLWRGKDAIAKVEKKLKAGSAPAASVPAAKPTAVSSARPQTPCVPVAAATPAILPGQTVRDTFMSLRGSAQARFFDAHKDVLTGKAPDPNSREEHIKNLAKITSPAAQRDYYSKFLAPKNTASFR